jgi:hypothetical protein
VFVLLFSFGIPVYLKIGRLTRVQSPYRNVVGYISSLNNGKHISTMWPISAVYGGAGTVTKYPLNSYIDLVNAYNNGYTYLLVDYQKYYFDYPDWLLNIEQTIPPVKTWSNPAVEWLYAIDDNHSRKDRKHILRSDPTVHVIKLYNLDDFFGAASRNQTQNFRWNDTIEPPTCYNSRIVRVNLRLRVLFALFTYT